MIIWDSDLVNILFIRYKRNYLRERVMDLTLADRLCVRRRRWGNGVSVSIYRVKPTVRGIPNRSLDDVPDNFVLTLMSRRVEDDQALGNGEPNTQPAIEVQLPIPGSRAEGVALAPSGLHDPPAVFGVKHYVRGSVSVRMEDLAAESVGGVEVVLRVQGAALAVCRNC